MNKYTIIFESILFIDAVRIVGMICFWFSVGIFLYLFLVKRRPHSLLLSLIQKFNFVELVIILFCIFKLISLIFYLTLNTFLIESSIINDIFNFKLNFIAESGIETTNNPTTPSTTGSTTAATTGINPSTSTTSSTPTTSTVSIPASSVPSTPAHPTNMNGNMAGVIMATALTGGLKLTGKTPGLGRKVGVIAGSIAAGAVGIIGANSVNSLSQDIAKKLLFGNTDFYSLLGYTRNSSFDLIIAIYQLQKFQLFFIYFILYNALLLYLNNDKVELFLKNKLSLSAFNRFTKILKYISKSSKFFIGFFTVLLVFFSILNLYYLGFFVENFDRICELYFENKPK